MRPTALVLAAAFFLQDPKQAFDVSDLVAPSSMTGALDAPSLESAIRRWIRPQRVEVKPSGELSVAGTAEQQEKVRALLGRLRAPLATVDVETHLFAAPHAAVAKLELGASSATLKSAADLEAFLAKLTADARFDPQESPRLVVAPGQKGSLSVSRQISYVKEWQLDLSPESASEIAEPVIGVIDFGSLLELRAFEVEPATFGVDLELTVSQLAAPMAKKKVRVSSTIDRKVEIDVPEVTRKSMRASLLLAKGASAVLVVPADDADRDLLVVVTVKKGSLTAPR